jgi:hypothetical protein
MPGLEELLAMRGGGGGGAPPPSQGQDIGGMAGALSAKLAELMQDPVALKGMRDFMQQQGGGMGAPGSAQAPPTGGPMDMTRGIPPGMEAPPGAPMDMPPGLEQDMVSEEIDRVGATWDGVDAPTQNDIQRLKEDPSEANIASFNEHFGEGEAEKYIGEAEDEDSPPPEGGASSEATEAY